MPRLSIKLGKSGKGLVDTTMVAPWERREEFERGHGGEEKREEERRYARKPEVEQDHLLVGREREEVGSRGRAGWLAG